jgi:hypothetical protein
MLFCMGACGAAGANRVVGSGLTWPAAKPAVAALCPPRANAEVDPTAQANANAATMKDFMTAAPGLSTSLNLDLIHPSSRAIVDP